MIDETFKVAELIKDRTPKDILVHLMEEVGELATEIAIHSGTSAKKAGEDGIIGEAVDVALCALDIIYIQKPNITESEVMDIVTSKLIKWYSKNKK